MKNYLRTFLASALLLIATGAVAGIIFVPVGGRYINPDLAPVDIQNNGNGQLRVRTANLQGELSLDAGDVPPAFEIPLPGCARLPFDQGLDMNFNLSEGIVEGRSRGRISTLGSVLDYRAELRGNATCVAYNGRSCGQLVVDVELRGTLADPGDPARVGLLRMEMLGSLLRGPGNARWQSLTSSARLGGDADLINSLLDTMSEGDSCGI